MDIQSKKKLAQELKADLSQLTDKRKNWESHWQEVADLMLPRKSDITQQRQRGDKRNLEIFDSSATHSLELLASSLHGSLTAASTRWFSLRFKNSVLADDDSANEWLQDSEQKMYLAFDRSNFQQEVFKYFICLIG